MTPQLEGLSVRIFADGADRAGIVRLAANPLVSGFTTNPTLMRAAGVSDYESFARDLLEQVHGLPISFEVFSDEFDDMERQALKISSWGDNVFVKIPVTNTRGESSAPLIAELAAEGVKLNVTALMSDRQVSGVAEALSGGTEAFVSLFAGRIADTGRDPVPIVAAALEHLAPYPYVRLIWASPREVLNVFEADAVGCHIITVTHDLLKKLEVVGRDLDEFSLETVAMFHRDAAAAGYQL